MTDTTLTHFPSPPLKPPPAPDFTITTPGTGPMVFTNPGKPVLIIKADGTKLRGGDEKPLDDLDAQELRALIDDLVSVFRGPVPPPPQVLPQAPPAPASE